MWHGGLSRRLMRLVRQNLKPAGNVEVMPKWFDFSLDICPVVGGKPSSCWVIYFSLHHSTIKSCRLHDFFLHYKLEMQRISSPRFKSKNFSQTPEQEWEPAHWVRCIKHIFCILHGLVFRACTLFSSDSKPASCFTIRCWSWYCPSC